MIDKLKKEKCCGCEACSNACPTNAIQMEMDREGFYYPKIQKERCTVCDKCEKVCPVLNKKQIKNEQIRAYACYNRDEKVREYSTSGGIFSVLANYFIEQKKGIVYGAKFDSAFRVVHEKALMKGEVKAFCGSKYVQSRIENVYQEIKAFLEKGKSVLFSGLPCQIQALKSYLSKEYDCLYTIDMICFGVGSPLIWDNYLEVFHKKDNLEKFIFKDKKDGWKEWKVKVVEEGKEFYYERKENLYMNSYLQRINVRPSCFQCDFKGIDRESDFTIADCWGIGEQNERLNDDKGLSALLLHSQKAVEIFDAVKQKFLYEEYDPKELMEGNWATYHNPMNNECREDFFLEWDKNGFRDTFQKYFGK